MFGMIETDEITGKKTKKEGSYNVGDISDNIIVHQRKNNIHGSVGRVCVRSRVLVDVDK